jgi:integrase/recombinase XerD
MRDKARALPKTLTGEEVERLMAAPNVTCPTGLRDLAMMQLMYRSGLRVSETCGLHLRDIDWRAGEIRLRAEITKGNREAVVYPDDATLDLLDRWKAMRRPYAAGKPHLFVVVKRPTCGEPLDRRKVYEMVRRRGEKAGIEQRVTPHMLRHTHATRMLGDGFTILDVQKSLRHSSPQTTAIYLHVRDSELKAKMRARSW